MPPEGNVIKAQSVRAARAAASSDSGDENRKLYATVAYYYPQYTLNDVQDMPYRDVALLIKTAQKIEAERMHNLTLIASAPHSEKGRGVKTLLKHFKDIADSNG